MNGKLTLSFSVATFVAALGVMWFLADVRTRLAKVELDVAAQQDAEPAPAAASPGPGDGGSRLAGGGEEERKGGNPLETKDPLVKLDWLIEKLEEVDDNGYEYYNDMAQEQYSLKRDLGRLRAVVMRILQGLRSSGDFPGLQPDLPEPHAQLTEQDIARFTAAAASYGIKVEPGLVTARGLLNGAQDKAYPVEYFMTRFPDAGHETLVHLIGSASVEDFRAPPFPDLGGLPTAFYKALLAAGFKEGEASHPEPGAENPRAAKTILATGDRVYLYVRYEQDGKTVFGRAVDWIIDPETGGPLPEDCFRFTGSIRIEDQNTGEPMLLSEPRGFLASVRPDPAALIEIALPSSLKENYQYNWARMPKHPADGKPFYVDLVFSKTPIEK